MTQNNKTSKKRRIGDIENYYGGLFVKIENDKYYFGIENYDGTTWERIHADLYEELIIHPAHSLHELEQNK